MDSRLVMAAKTGDVECLLRLIGEDSLLLDNVSLAGPETPLHIASMRGHLPFVQEMLRKRMQFAYDLNQDGFTPLHLASANGHLQIVLELLKLDPGLCTIQGRDDRLALHCAVVKGRTDVIEKLLGAGPKDCVEMKTVRGETVFHLAVKNSQFGAFKLLVEHVKKLKKEQLLNEKDNQGNTFLHHATSRKQYKVIQLTLVEDNVIKSQVDVNSRNGGGMTPLDILTLFESEAGDLEIHAALVEAGAKRGKDLPSSSDPHPPTIITDNNNIPTLNLPIDQENNNNNNNNNNQFGRSHSGPSVYAASDALVTALALVATATYQAVLSPPGGLWQDDKLDATPPRYAGKSILATEHLPLFLIYTAGNTVGFMFSLFSITMLVESSLIIKLALYAVYFTYGFSVASIIPTGSVLLQKWMVATVLELIFASVPILHKIFWSLPEKPTLEDITS